MKVLFEEIIQAKSLSSKFAQTMTTVQNAASLNGKYDINFSYSHECLIGHVMQ